MEDARNAKCINVNLYSGFFFFCKHCESAYFKLLPDIATELIPFRLKINYRSVGIYTYMHTYIWKKQVFFAEVSKNLSTG